jgi:hypothetical protein
MMVHRAGAVQEVLRRLQKLPCGQGVDMRTFKRDRSVQVLRTGDDAFYVVQDGYERHEFTEVSLSALKKLLRRLLDKEFPRSNKIRLYTLDSFELADVNRMGHGSGRFGT